MSDEHVHLAFETPGAQSVVVDEVYLVTYHIRPGVAVTELQTERLYRNDSVTGKSVDEFLCQEARIFGCRSVIGIV